MTPIHLPLAELKPALTGLGKIINRSATLPVLQCLRVERTSDGWVCLTGTDLDRFVTVRLEQPAKGEPLVLIVPFDELQRLAKNSVKDEVLQLTMASKDTLAVHFTQARDLSDVKLRSFPVPEFPAIPRLKGESIPLPANLRTSLHEAMACSSSDETRYVLNGAFLDASKADAHYLVGTDGRHLYSSNSFRLPLQSSLIIPKHKFLGWREFNLDGDWQLKTGQPEGLNHRFVQLSSRRWRYLSRLIDGNYPNWQQVVPNPRDVRTTVSFDPATVEALLRSIQMLPCHNPENQTLGLEWRGGELHLLGKEAEESPWVRAKAPQVKGKGPDVTVFVDRRFVIKALEFGLLSLGIIDEMSPLRFSQGGKQMIVMPIRPHSAVPPQARPRQPAVTRHADTPAPTARSAETPPAATEAAPSPRRDALPPASIPQPTMSPESTSSPSGESAHGMPRIDDVLQMVDVIREGCLRSAGQLKDLSGKLRLIQRGQRSSEREMQSFRQTLRSLQGVRL